MSFAKVYSAQTDLIEKNIIDVEVDLSRGLHSFKIIGLPDKAIEEAKDRVASAIKNSGFKSPKQKNEKITVSLAPANTRKNGSNFDLAIGVAYLKSSKEIDFDPKGKIFIGELSLDGDLKPVHGILPLTIFAKEKGFKEIFLPKENAQEASIIEGVSVYGAEKFLDIIKHIDNSKNRKPIKVEKYIEPAYTDSVEIDIEEIIGQQDAKRAMLIAASGGHNISLWGPPGTGKTMLAKAFKGILPELSFEERLEVTSIHSIAGLNKNRLIKNPPIRSPHHTASYISICGGGANIKAGEITLAHKGILFLDEFPEFERRVIDSLRQPLEDKKIYISRASGKVELPADFILFITLNPCPCGFYESEVRDCICSINQIERYRQKITGPIVDRIDIWIKVGHINHKKLLDKNGGAKSAEYKEKIKRAREIQYKRSGKLNNSLSTKEIKEWNLCEDVKELLNTSSINLKLSPRGYYKTLKVACTIADLENSGEIKKEHLLEALQYRKRD